MKYDKNSLKQDHKMSVTGGRPSTIFLCCRFRKLKSRLLGWHRSDDLNSAQIARFMGPTWGPPGAPWWPHKPCYQGVTFHGGCPTKYFDSFTSQYKRMCAHYQFYSSKEIVDNGSKFQGLYSPRVWPPYHEIMGNHEDPRYGFHDDVIKWKSFSRYWPFVQGIHRSPVNSPHKGQWRGTVMFSLIWVWINGGVNTREAGDFTVML